MPWRDNHPMPPEEERACLVFNQTDEPLTALSALALFENWVDHLVEEAVRDCRAEGRSWAEIGTALGRSKQAVQQKYGHLNRADE